MILFYFNFKEKQSWVGFYMSFQNSRERMVVGFTTTYATSAYHN
jgi:hypothetical protein